jgi:hypothetical protein
MPRLLSGRCSTILLVSDLHTTQAISYIMIDFIPANDAALKTWCTTVKTKIATLGAGVYLTPVQITVLQGKCDAINGHIDAKMAAKTE